MRISKNVRMLMMLLCVLFLCMLSRLIFSPLLVFIQNDLSLTGKQVGSIFLIITLGYSPGMLLAGFFSARMRHRGTIVLALLLVALGTGISAISSSFWVMAVGLWILGFGTGMYPLSGIASITKAISESKTGKALAVHELGPALAFVAAPILVALLFTHAGWRMILGLIFFLNIGMAIFYGRFGIGGEGYGQLLNFTAIKRVIGLPMLWFNFLLFCVALSAMQGIFAFLPFYLITEKHLDVAMVNLLVGFSRMVGIATLLGSGYIVDRFGSRVVLIVVFTVSGLSTFGIVGTDGPLLTFFVVLQPALLSAFFPAGLLALSRISPPESQSVTLGLVITASVLVGNGFVPTFIGLLADMGAISVGLLSVGAAMLVMVAALYRVRSYGS